MKKQNGISLIALIVTIIVMIIIAFVVVGAIPSILPRTVQARFMSDFSTYREAVIGTCTEHRFLVLQQSKTNKQIYYEVANNLTSSEVEDIVPTGTVSTLEIKDYLVGELSGNEYYEILPDADIVGYEEGRDQIYTHGEKFYITDEGEVFTLPGFMDTTGDEPKYWISTDLYYTGTPVDSGEPEDPEDPEEPEEPETPVEPDDPEEPDVPGDDSDYTEAAPGSNTFYNSETIKINGEEFKLVGDISSMEFQKNGDGYPMNLQLSKGDAFTFGSEVFYMATDQAPSVGNNDRDSVISHVGVITLNLGKGLTTPGPDTEIGDLALKNGKVCVYIGNPYYMPPDGSGYTYESWWVELNEEPQFQWK